MNYILIFSFLLSLPGCKSAHKAEKIDTQLESGASVSGGEKVGVKNGEMVVQTKAQMGEALRDLQNSVYGLEDKVYGTRKLNTLGLYGDLKSCRRRMASRQYGGSGTLVWTEPLDRVTEREEELKVGLNDNKELVAVTEEFLKDRIKRFQGYRTILQKRADEFQSQIDTCTAELKDKEFDGDQPSKVMVQEVAKANFDKEAINKFMCGFVKKGASLQGFMINAFAKGWLSLGDYRLDQNLVAASLRDSKGISRENGILFSGWKMSFDTGGVSVGDLLNEGKDARLVSWAYDKKGDPTESAACIATSDGQWKP